MGLASARVLDGIDFWGTHGVAIRKFTGDSAYVSGGYTLNGSNFGFGSKPLEGVVLLGVRTALAANFTPVYDLLNKKLVIIQGASSELTYAQGDIKGSVTTDVAIISGALQTNGQLISTLAAANNTTAFTIALQPDIPRNLGIAYKNATGGSSTGNAVDNVIVGTFRGVAQTETVSFSASELTSTSNNEVGTKYTTKPFDSITSITPSAAQPASWQHAVGPGSKLGLPQPTLNNLEADIIKLFKNAANLSPTGLYGTAGTVNFGTLADGDDISVIYKPSGATNPGTDLSGCQWVLMGVCRGS